MNLDKKYDASHRKITQCSPITGNMPYWPTFATDRDYARTSTGIDFSLIPFNKFPHINQETLFSFFVRVMDEIDEPLDKLAAKYLDITRFQLRKIIFEDNSASAIWDKIINSVTNEYHTGILLDAYKEIPDYLWEEKVDLRTGEASKGLSANGIRYYKDKITHSTKTIEMLQAHQIKAQDGCDARTIGVLGRGKVSRGTTTSDILSITFDDLSDDIENYTGSKS